MKIRKMKRISCLCMVLCIVIAFLQPLSPNTAKAANKPSVFAHAYAIVDANSQQLLLQYQANKKIYPASTVKLMTALVVLDYCNTSDQITITKTMLSKVSSSSAKVGLRAGDTYTVSSLLHMLLLPSAADASYVLAYGSCGSLPTFLKQMNQKASAYGMTHTSFDNPVGLDKGDRYYKTYTTAKDFTILARHAMSNATIRNIVAKASYRVPKAKHKKSFVIHSTNQFYRSVPYDRASYQIIGTKTGTTRAAGSVLIATAKDKAGHEVICAFFGNRSHSTMYADIRKLLDYIFKQENAGNLTLKKGFWDVRYTEEEDLIQTAYDEGLLSQASRFYPEQAADQTTLYQLINIFGNSNLQTTEEDADQPLSLLAFAQTFYNNYGGGQLPSCIADLPETEWQAAMANYCNSLNIVEELSQTDYMALCFLIQNNLWNTKLPTDPSDSLTKSQAVLLGHEISTLQTTN